jgi:uncharacterized protein YcaQ
LLPIFVNFLRKTYSWRVAVNVITLTNQQARRFLLKKHGLLGDYRFFGKSGVLDYVRQTGSVQYDPIDVCGKNSELVFQSRIPGFQKEWLAEVLYCDRDLIDHMDKCMCLVPTVDWPYFSHVRDRYRQSGYSSRQIDAIAASVVALIEQQGAVCSKDLPMEDKVHWYWSDTRLARAALETLYLRGVLAIHHKKGTVKYYSMLAKTMPADIAHAPDPLADAFDKAVWLCRRRIGAVGMMWNAGSDAWLEIPEFHAKTRDSVFAHLVDRGDLIPLQVEGIARPLYCLAADKDLLNEVAADAAPLSPRTELIAPLDCLMWDRKLIRALFDFDYTWEIYTPPSKRKFGYYVLPLLQGDRFIGRIEAVRNAKAETLDISSVWLERDVRPTKKLTAQLQVCFRRFAKFNRCARFDWDGSFKQSL